MNPNDPDVIALSKAIVQHESGGNPDAVGDAGTSHGLGQWQPATWKAQAHDVLGDANAPMTPQNQKAVLQVTVAKRKAAGLNPAQIAAEWNSGSPDNWENKIGTTTINGQQIHYNVPKYVKDVTDLYHQYKGGSQQTNPNQLIQGDQQQPDQQGGTNDLLQPQGGADQLDQQIAQLTAKGKEAGTHPGFFQGLNEDLQGTNPESIPEQLGNTIKGVGNFLFPAVGDVYHDIKGDSTKTALQQVGDVGSTALSAATLVPGVGEGALALKAGLTGAKGAEIAAKAAPTLAGSLAKNGALGAAFGATGALGSGETDPTKIAESAGIGGATGGVLGGASHILGERIGGAAAATGEGRLTAQTNRLKTLSKSFADNSRGETNPIKTLEQNGFTKQIKVVNGKVDATALTNPQNTGAIDNEIENHSAQASDLVKSLQGTVPIKDAEATVIQQIANNPSIRDVGGVSKAQAEAKRIFADLQNSYGTDLPYTAIDNIRAGMNRVYDPAERDTARTIGDTMREYLYNGSGTNQAIKSAMANEAELIRARNFVERLHGTTVPGGQLGKYFADLLGGAAGAAAGSMFGPLGEAVGTVVGGAATHKLGNFVQGNYFNPMTAKGAGALQKATKGGVGKVLRGTAKAGALRTASSIVQ